MAKPRLSIVVPTLNEATGIGALISGLLEATAPLGGVEVLVMDDRSVDDTVAIARAALGGHGRVVVRDPPGGLSRSVIDGWRRAEGRVVGVMDADLSHPPHVIPRLLAAIEEGGADLAVGTRYMPGGGIRGWSLQRHAASQAATRIARTLVRARDPLSGFLLLRREVIAGIELDPTGWKITLDVLVRGRWSHLAEVPYVFADRAVGESKFGGGAVREFLEHATRLRVHLLKQGRLRR